MMRRLAAMAIALLVAACAVPTSSTAPGIVQNPNAVPGPVPVSPARGIEFFEGVCVATYPSFQGALAQMAARGVTQQARTGTVFHPRLNLSMRLLPETRECSLVFVTNGSTSDMARALASIGEAQGVTAEASSLALRHRRLGQTFFVRSSPGPGGTFYNIRIMGR